MQYASWSNRAICRWRFAVTLPAAWVATWLATATAQTPCNRAAPDDHTIALWLFDEPDYPGMTLTDASRHQFDLRLKTGGKLVPGRFGNAVQLSKDTGVAIEYACPTAGMYRDPKPQFLAADVVPEQFNLGYLDWTVEFWFKAEAPQATRGVVFEVGPLATELVADVPNSLCLEADSGRFVLRSAGMSVDATPGKVNQTGGITTAEEMRAAAVEIILPTDHEAVAGVKPGWHHLAFSFSAQERQVRHFVDGRLQPLPRKGGFLPMKGQLNSLSIGRDRKGEQPLVGSLDELRFSSNARYLDDFELAGTFSHNHSAGATPPANPNGPPLLFEGGQLKGVAALGSRKHVFLDGALLAEHKNLSFAANPPRWEVTDFRIDQPSEPGPRFGPGIPDVLSVDDDDGVFRMAYTNGGMWGGKPGAICVAISDDGLHWKKPQVGLYAWDGSTANNIVLTDDTQGTMFRDPNPAAAPDERYKYIAFSMQRGIYVYTSADGWHWKRNETIALPFDCGGGAETFWDDQRGAYCLFLRHEGAWTDVGGPGRACALAQTREPLKPWPFRPSSNPGVRRGIFTLPSVTQELPIAIGPNNYGQPYRSTAVKYLGATDAYVAFPWRYDGVSNRRPGSELMVSRDGQNWSGYGEPFYLASELEIEGRPVIEALMQQGMGVRGNDVVQFATARFTAHGGAAYGGAEYEGGIHDRFLKLTQRLDGFVSLDAGETSGIATTHPLTFTGSRLELNVCAKGTVRVGLSDETAQPLPGFGLDDCDPITADAVRHVVTWRKQADLGSLAGKVVKLKLELVDAKLYALQFLSD